MLASQRATRGTDGILRKGSEGDFVPSIVDEQAGRPPSMADCVALATSAALGEPLATSDPSLATAANLEGVAIVPLPDTTGRRPTT